MNLYDSFPKAWEAAAHLFYKSKTDDPVYIFPVHVGRKEFFTVFSVKQVTQYKLPLKKADWTVGGTIESIESKKRLQDSMPNHAEMTRLRAINNVYRAQRRLEKVLSKGKGAEGESLA
ncbi:MAG: hypothetical protein P4N59_10635 [Negativicutes bacterium]|nr:hypothetical protein [Negativicutes bacterium]